MTTPDLVPITYYYVHLLEPPHLPLMPSYFLPPQSYSSVLNLHRIIRPPGRHPSPFQHTRKKLHPPFHHLSLPEPESSSPPSPSPRQPDSHLRLSHAASEISFSVVFSCRYAAVCCHHCSRNLPPPSYAVPFAQTSNIGHRDTHSATIAYLLFIYYRRGLVPAAWSTLSDPSFRQVSSPSLRGVIPVTF